VSKKPATWYAPGDVNAFFGLMLDNVAGLILMVSLLHAGFAFPTNFALRYMAPGTAIGVLVGDLLFFFMALRMARRTGRSDVTAMPLGLDTPSTFGMVLFVLGPAFATASQTMPEHQAAIYTWEIGICAIFVSGIFKLACAFASGWIRRVVPRAGLLGSLAAIALVLISFLPLLEILHLPVVGFISLAVILATLVARIDLPFKIPGALGALLIGGAMYYLMLAADQFELFGGYHFLEHTSELENASAALLPYEWTSVFTFEWMKRLTDPAFHSYLPIIIPFALATVVGGIDCTESAAAAGDDFHTGQVIGVEAVATIVAGMCGGVIQTTPYIGHPAYKMMGGRSAYTLLTALFIGSAGLIGYFGYLYEYIPKPTVFPILVFIGLEITAQSFHATPRRHYPAVAFACVPALAYLALMFTNQLIGAMYAANVNPSEVIAAGKLEGNIQTVRMLANGFIITSLLWASALAAIIDRRFVIAALFFVIAGVCGLFGVIHSPIDGAPMYLPWNLEPELAEAVYRFSAGYVAAAVVLVLWSVFLKPEAGDEIGEEEDAGSEADAVT